MLKLSEEQYQKLQVRDVQNFVAAVADDYLESRPDMIAEPGRAVVIARMQAAYDNGRRLGFISTPHIIYMMYMSADMPGMFERPGTQQYLLRPGLTPEQRLDDMKAVLHHHFRDLELQQEY